MFTSIMESVTGTLTIETAVVCTVVSLLLGLVVAAIYMASSGKKYSKNYIATLILLPALVQVVIMLVNGNLGTGVAIMGAFSLVRFRSMPGSAKEICGIFFSMTIGVATGMGYISYAVVITVIIGCALFIIGKVPIAESGEGCRELKIIIPEDLDYTEVFDDIFERYTTASKLMKVKTTNMGSMYELTYQVFLRASDEEKRMIDQIRTRNGNLAIICGRPVTEKEEL